MDHVAILRRAKISKGDNLLGDIIAGKKTVESRWYVNKIDPWGKININDTVYFKESGCSVTAKAKVIKIIQIDNLNPSIMEKIVKDYGHEISPNTTKEQWLKWVNRNHHKRYCILIFLKGVKVIKPFDINKAGFGISAAWLVVQNIADIKK